MIQSMKFLYVFIGLIIISSNVFANDQISIIPFIPQNINDTIKKYSSVDVLRFIFTNDTKRETFLRNISEGKGNWLNLFPSLKNVSDAGWSWMLDMALLDALDTNPQKTISCISKVRNSLKYANKICGSTSEDWNEDLPIQSLAPFAIEKLEQRKNIIKKQNSTVAEKCYIAIEQKIIWWNKKKT